MCGVNIPQSWRRFNEEADTSDKVLFHEGFGPGDLSAFKA
jgi:hypothetical protein